MQIVQFACTDKKINRFVLKTDHLRITDHLKEQTKKQYYYIYIYVYFLILIILSKLLAKAYLYKTYIYIEFLSTVSFWASDLIILFLMFFMFFGG